jgi:hypothetical protein
LAACFHALLGAGIVIWSDIGANLCAQQEIRERNALTYSPIMLQPIQTHTDGSNSPPERFKGELI